jgi:hypothetical protein
MDKNIKGKAVPVHAMKVYGGITHNIGIRWRQMVSLMPEMFYAQGKGPQYPSNMGLVGPQNQSVCCGEKVNLLSLPGIKPWIAQPVACGEQMNPLSLSGITPWIAQPVAL